MPYNYRNDLTAEQVRTCLAYDRQTGIFRWRDHPNLAPGQRKFIGKIAGSPNPEGYIRIKLFGHLYLAQRLAWLYVTGEWPSEEVDHKDKNTANNAFDNLREATPLQNTHNQTPRANSSGYQGVTHRPKENKWRARIMIDGKRVILGDRDTPEAAYELYKAAATLHRGEFLSL